MPIGAEIIGRTIAARDIAGAAEAKNAARRCAELPLLAADVGEAGLLLAVVAEVAGDVAEAAEARSLLRIGPSIELIAAEAAVPRRELAYVVELNIGCPA